MPAATASRKRKQTEDMETSPPKRVTRARSARTQDTAVTTKPARAPKASTTAETADKPKPTAASIRSAPPAKRSTRSKDAPDPTQTEQAEPEPPKTRGRPKKMDAIQGRSKAAKPTAIKAAPAANKTRARTQVTAADESEDELTATDYAASKLVDEEPEPAPVVKKTTRARAAAASKSAATSIKVTAPSTRAAASTRATGATASTTARSAAAKKRVAFAENAQDKENAPIRGKASNKSKADEKHLTTGARAKPVRKAAAASTTASSAKTRAAGAKKVATEKPAPLSPKKVGQVAKGNSSESEDELVSNSPGRMIARSPVRPPQSVRKEMSFPGSSLESSSRPATQESSEPLLSQSPMKPPQSTRKEMSFASASAQSITKLGFTTTNDSAGRQPALATSLLLSPAKRLPASSAKVATSGEPASPSRTSSQLLASPAKRVHMDIPRLDKEDSHPEPSLKQSLLQSPARRPKGPLPGSMTSVPMEKRPLFAFGDAPVSSLEIQTFNFSAATPRKVLPRQKKEATNVVQSPCGEQLDDDGALSDEISLSSFDQREKEPLSDAGADELDFDNTMNLSPSQGVPDGETGKLPDDPGHEEQMLSTTPPGLPTQITFSPGGPSTLTMDRELFREDQNNDSEDELSARGSFRASNNSLATPTPGLGSKLRRPENTDNEPMPTDVTDLGLTPLAHQLSAWQAQGMPEPQSGRSIDSSPMLSKQDQSPVKQSYFDDEMLARQPANESEPSRDFVEEQQESNISDNHESENATAESSEGHSEYGDENAMPVDPQLIDFTVPMDMDFTIPMDIDTVTGTADPLELNMTPGQVVRPIPREVMTVSKVPLKPADSGSPTKSLRKRAKSLAPFSLDDASTATPDTSIELTLSPGPQPSEVVTPPRNKTVRLSTFGSPRADDTLLQAATPFRTPRVGADAQILRGAVIYVDVHTTEGADANGIFVELLTQMGARCVKQWSWNPRSSTTGNNGETPGGSKIGITHVVFKDGGRRTLSKVREARGLVACVGVGWVLDCERKNKWLDEADYLVDADSVPRGGHNRRKSMEPRPLTNINGTLKSVSGTPARSVSTPTFNMSPTKEFLTFSNDGSPADDFGSAFDAPTPTINFGGANMPLPETPAVLKDQNWDFEAADDESGKMPSTPYFMTKGAELVQATCPPKQQTGRMLFPVSGKIEDEPDENIRRRLALARRKSLQWAPRVGSPLRRE